MFLDTGQAKPKIRFDEGWFMKIKVFFIILLLSLMSGCTVVGAGVVAAIGGTHYIAGEIKASYETSIYHLYEATLYTFEIKNMEIVSVKNTKLDADIVAKLADDREVKVHIYYNKEGYSTLGLRIGFIGDEDRSRELLREIERYI